MSSVQGLMEICKEHNKLCNFGCYVDWYQSLDWQVLLIADPETNTGGIGSYPFARHHSP